MSTCGLLIGLSYIQFNSLPLGKHSFWIWQLYISSDLYTAIVGLPLICVIGYHFLSTVFFSNMLTLLRFKDKTRLFKQRMLLQLVFIGSFILLIGLLGSLICLLSATYHPVWESDNINQYTHLFLTVSDLEIPLIKQVILTTINFWLYLLLLLSLHHFLRLLFKEKIALFLVIGFIFLQSFLYKMTNHSPLLALFPVYHYQVTNVTDVFGNISYWVISHVFLNVVNYFLTLKGEYK